MNNQKANSLRRSDKIAAMAIAIFVCLLTSSCSPDTEVTNAAGSCPAKLYGVYNPKNMSQCVGVCKNCDRGTTATCTTSCTLKGAR